MRGVIREIDHYAIADNTQCDTSCVDIENILISYKNVLHFL